LQLPSFRVEPSRLRWCRPTVLSHDLHDIERRVLMFGVTPTGS
jgi:hypothetical protein